MSKIEIYSLLNAERERVISPDTGHVMRKEAWERIDWLLDCIIELNRMDNVVPLVETGHEL